jgi:pimeloyl-ACP methyl ester carboxylesterase
MSKSFTNHTKNNGVIHHSKRSVSWNDMELAYRVFGNGETIILCFHGHGRSAEDFKFLSTPHRKIISVDLFLHGDSTFDPSRIYKDLITVEHVEKLLEKLFQREKIDRFHWVAYSQGGRFTLALFPRFAKRVLSLNLIAPDGMNDNNFYNWSQRRWWARSLFKRWVKRPQELMSIAKALAQAKIIRPKIIDFLNYYTADESRLQLAYASWRGFRKLRPTNELIKSSLIKTKIPFQLIIGRYDQIITSKSGRAFLNSIHQQSALIEIPFGHDVFKPHIEKKLFQLLNFENFEQKKTNLNV